MSSPTTSVSATCHCKAITLHLPYLPAHLNECHCSICRRYGVQWAYYQIKQVSIICEADATEFYLWGDKELEFHRCRKCGCVTHWIPVDKDKSGDEIGINGRLLEKADLEEMPVMHTRRGDVDFE
jgi:hypothetical protein